MSCGRARVELASQAIKFAVGMSLGVLKEASPPLCSGFQNRVDCDLGSIDDLLGDSSDEVMNYHSVCLLVASRA